MTRGLTIAGFFLFLAGVTLFLVQLWAQIWSAEIFSKLLITDAALFAIVAVLAFLVRENRESDHIHRGSDLS